LANTNLGWESTTQLDLGLDAAFFNKRLSLTVDYYRKLTDDILLNLDIPATIGLTAPPQNAGSVENKGWEFGLNYRGGQGNSGFRYTLGGNLSINENKVTDLKGTGPYITGSDIDPRYIIAKGLPINTLWGYQTDGLFQTEAEIAEYKATYATNTKPGDVKYIDRNKDGKINADDMTAIGNSFPKYTFGVNSDFSYKNFELNILFQGAAKWMHVWPEHWPKWAIRRVLRTKFIPITTGLPKIPVHVFQDQLSSTCAMSLLPTGW
jgi:outer membrane receptor protein involved in Fe transport